MDEAIETGDVSQVCRTFGYFCTISKTAQSRPGFFGGVAAAVGGGGRAMTCQYVEMAVPGSSGVEASARPWHAWAAASSCFGGLPFRPATL